MTSKWRERMKVHPSADVFPMMSDDELAKLGEDIKANGLTSPIVIVTGPDGEHWIIDGRNRLEAMERNGGIQLNFEKDVATYIPTWEGVPAYVISANIHRRHLTKQAQADLIVAAIKAGAEASRQVGEVPKRHVKGKAGSEKDPVKAEAVATAAEHGIGQRTVERAIAKAEGREPKPKPVVGDENWKALVKEGKEVVERLHADERRPRTLEEHAEIINDEWNKHIEALHEAAGHLAEVQAVLTKPAAFQKFLTKDCGFSQALAKKIPGLLAKEFDGAAWSDAFLDDFFDRLDALA